jgi:hypothetical protein
MAESTKHRRPQAKPAASPAVQRFQRFLSSTARSRGARVAPGEISAAPPPAPPLPPTSATEFAQRLRNAAAKPDLAPPESPAARAPWAATLAAMEMRQQRLLAAQDTRHRQSWAELAARLGAVERAHDELSGQVRELR